MEIILIRHTSVNVPPGVCYGQSDVPLRDTFNDEAAVVKEKLSRYTPFDMVYTSPLSRCTQLAAKCGYHDAIRERRIIELDFGAWEMQRYDDITDPRLQEWYDDYFNVAPTGGESFVMQYRRISEFLDEVRSEPFNRVAIFTHGGVMMCAMVYAKCVKMEEAFSYRAPYGGIVSISI